MKQALTMASNARRLAKNLVQSAVEKTNTIIRSTDAHLLGKNIATINITADSEKSGEVGTHVEDLCRASLNLANRGDTVSRNICGLLELLPKAVCLILTSMVSQRVEARARTSLICLPRCLEWM